MFKFISYIFLGISVLLVIIGLTFKSFNLNGGAILPTIGFFGIFIYYLIKSIKDYAINRYTKLKLLLQVVIILMSYVLFTEYIGFIINSFIVTSIVLLFIITTAFYWIKENLKELHLTTIVILFYILSIPLLSFGLIEIKYSSNFHVLNNYYDTSTKNDDKVQFSYIYKGTKILCDDGYKYFKLKNYYKSIHCYETALEMEPNNPMILYYLAVMNIKVKDYRCSIDLLNKSINHFNSYASFYNMRGIAYLKLNMINEAIEDFNHAININSDGANYHANLAMAYFLQGTNKLACKRVKIAIKHGYDINTNKKLRRLWLNGCK